MWSFHCRQNERRQLSMHSMCFTHFHATRLWYSRFTSSSTACRPLASTIWVRVLECLNIALSPRSRHVFILFCFILLWNAWKKAKVLLLDTLWTQSVEWEWFLFTSSFLLDYAIVQYWHDYSFHINISFHSLFNISNVDISLLSFVLNSKRGMKMKRKKSSRVFGTVSFFILVAQVD